MSVVMVVFAILGTTVTVLAALAGLVWWAYKRGQAAGTDRAGRDAARAEDVAKIEALQRQLAETRADLADTRAELTALQPKRQRTPVSRSQRPDGQRAR
jgi:hypothetical protein